MILRGDIDGKISKIQTHDVTRHMAGRRAFTIVGGEFAIVAEHFQIAIHTILGSCVSIGFYDRQQHIKALNHFLLPTSSSLGESYRYGLNSVETMLNQMYKMGCEKKHIVAKISGGANVLHSSTSHIGEKNIRFARDFCQQEKIPVLSEHVGGFHGRVILMVEQFEILTRKISNKAHDEQLAKEEAELARKIASRKREEEDDVTLF